MRVDIIYTQSMSDSNRFILRTSYRTPNAFILATLVSGFAYFFNNQQVKQFNSRQQQLITRIEQDTQVTNFKKQFKPHDADLWDCKKVNLDGLLGQGRFFIKRKRGDQDGYLVMAPFSVNTFNAETYINSQTHYKQSTGHRKFVLNMGWIPQSRKSMVYSILPNDILGQEEYGSREEALAKQKQDGIVRDPYLFDFAEPVVNVTAYIRRGEPEDAANGRTNFAKMQLFKWINLTQLSRIFRMPNEQQAQVVYLQRTSKNADDPEVLPLPATKQTVIQDLTTQAQNYEKNSNKVFWGLTGAAYAVASWITFL